MLIKIILAFPVFVGIILILIGVFLYIRRTKLGIHTIGVITGVNKLTANRAKVKMKMESPVVRYTVKGQEYNCSADQYQVEGVSTFKKGQKIEIRVNRKNHRIFNLVTKGAVFEPFFIFGGIFVILAYAIIYVRYF